MTSQMAGSDGAGSMGVFRRQRRGFLVAHEHKRSGHVRGRRRCALGDVGEAGEAREGDSEARRCDKPLGRSASAGTREVLAKGLVPYIVGAVLDGPVLTDTGCRLIQISPCRATRSVA